MEKLDYKLQMELGKKIFSIGGPSGAGKDTVVGILLANHYRELCRFPRITTRPPRANEKERLDYFFSDLETFLTRQHQGLIVASDFYSGNYYGVDQEKLFRWLVQEHSRKIVLVGGICGVRLKSLFETMTNIYLVASPDELYRRVKMREGNHENTQRAMREAIERIEKEIPLFDIVVENHNGCLYQTVKKVTEIIGLSSKLIIF